MTVHEYWKASREPRYSLLFAFPLLALYEMLAFAMSRSAFAGVRNGADVLLKTAFVATGGRHGLAAFTLLLLGAGAWFFWRDRRSHPGPLIPRFFGGMLIESLIYAALLGGVVSSLTALLLEGPLAIYQGATGPARLPVTAQLVVSLGAGLYEELLFRVLLVSAIAGIAARLRWKRSAGVGAAVVGSALIFSAFHYIGPLGDTLTLASFTFRAVAGVLLSGLYVTRGFGIAAWTHALYDVGLALIDSG
ncbi:MAG TPA: CPBP family intramembrane glutamic endopeptidase [Gemmatimonadales bacterium]